MHNPMEFPPIMIPRHHFDMCRYGRDPGDRKIFEMVSEAIRRIEKESPKAKCRDSDILGICCLTR